MGQDLILASGSAIRAQMLRNAAVPFRVQPARVDEEALRQSLDAEGTPPRDMSDALAEMKAQRVSAKAPGSMVIGCDQILALGKTVFAKPESREEAAAQLKDLRGQQHSLYSAAVICEDGRPVWRHITEVRMRMHRFSDAYLDSYLERNWPAVATSVGAYQIESEGVRLFSSITGDYFAILGLPLTELLSFLALRGLIEQ
ncbi:septum formation protein Maf [Pseudooceanicola sp. 216_PA32_1]|jgi:septum formation protein|uniref:Nucleoside triphosphate pyrophosphatase n=1 Tax=Pseudooceanicola pacificus TaxID=2676438 RepID=A0A844W2L1_9RHOB|nr:Maf family nucleotide pyrophosphatase [Pseudooceanicola pacificus]MWB76934.1 septum formation protein Maf [Pseudooceanicola pacificus]